MSPSSTRKDGDDDGDDEMKAVVRGVFQL
jgi:hypothetical protein